MADRARYGHHPAPITDFLMEVDAGAAATTITAPNGAIYHVTLDGDDLWIHVEPAPGHGVRIDYDANAGNEGWLRLQQQAALRAALPVRPRAVA